MTSAQIAAAIAAAAPIEGAAGPFASADGLPWTVYPAKDGSFWRIDFAAATEAQQQAAIAALAAIDTTVPPAPMLTYLHFRALFTAGKQAAIMTAAQSSHAVLDWLLQAAGAAPIDMANPTVKAGVDALVAAGLITADREAVILAGQVAA